MTALSLANDFFHFTPHAWCSYSSKPFSMLFILPFKAPSRPCEAFLFKSWVNTRLGHGSTYSIGTRKTQIETKYSNKTFVKFFIKELRSLSQHDTLTPWPERGGA